MPNLPGRLVVIAPTRHLKEQWADAAQRFGLHLVVDWVPGDLVPGDAHGVVSTYQQVGSSPEAFFDLSQGGFAILDEVHHAGEERSWGDGVRAGFDAAARRLALSGTPFRSDTQSIPFVEYHLDEAVPDVEYGYREALSDGAVVRPVYFPRLGGHMEWTAPDGAQLAASFDDPLVRTQANQRLRAALSLEGEWLPAVLRHANQQLQRIREQHADAGGLVIASDQDHARGITKLLRDRFGVSAELALSDDPDASARISGFARSNKPWIVAVKMISEGVDIPRLRVGVFATNTTTELFFRQAVGRIVRHLPNSGSQRAYMFIPDDHRLRHYGHTIADTRRHSLVKNSREVEAAERTASDADQMSLFAVHSATASDLDGETDIFLETGAAPVAEPEISDDLVIDLRQLPPPASGGTLLSSGGGQDGSFDRNERDRLRRINQDLTQELVKLTGRAHKAVNAELNRRSGIAKTAEATIIQLNRRSRTAEEWLRQEHRRRRHAGRTA